QRLSIEDAVRRTDEAVAAKDREIAELQRMLDQQSSTLGEVAVGAQAIAHMLDQDEIVRQERENLQKVQEEWRQKLRQAEVDISLERAKLARERSKLEEQVQNIESERARLESATGGAAGEAGAKKANRRWLARLGLKEDEQ
ncbi:MAG: hypothetical protein KY475_04490, partial [Planctomycetes bacterium]|nr:hypothetical protein [Planctomycetota bacterium]